MPDPTPEGWQALAIERLIAQAVRRLPKGRRDEYRQMWRSEIQAIPAEERLAYARGFPQAVPGILAELDPELAAVKALARPFVLVGFSLKGLAVLGVERALMNDLALSVLSGVGIMLFALLTTQCVLSLREVRRVWWRVLALVAVTLFTAWVTLTIFAVRSVFFPAAIPLLLAFLILGIYKARVLHVPRTVRSS